MKKKKKQRLEPIVVIENNFKTKEEFLKWRKEILERYEKSKIEYQKEINNLLGIDDDINK